MKPWIAILGEGKFETSLSALVLSKASGEKHEGSGQISWTLTGGIRLRATTHSETIVCPGSGIPYEVGKLVPLDAHLQLSGTSDDNYNIVGRVESRGGAVTESPFPLPAHRTGRADFPHPALGQELILSPTGSVEDGHISG